MAIGHHFALEIRLPKPGFRDSTKVWNFVWQLLPCSTADYKADFKQKLEALIRQYLN
jgi:hypothetical protein